MVSAISWGLPVNLSPIWSYQCHATSARSPFAATSFSRPRNPPTRDAVLDAVTMRKDTDQQDGNAAEIPPFAFL